MELNNRLLSDGSIIGQPSEADIKDAETIRRWKLVHDTLLTLKLDIANTEMAVDIGINIHG